MLDKMKFDTIIIGGGLSGLTCGIVLAKAGQNVAIVSAGQSNLHFTSGSLSLIGYKDGQEVKDPLGALGQLPETHPYRKISNPDILADQARKLLEEAGIKMQGDNHQNHYRLSPTGKLIPAWLTMDGLFTVNNAEELKGKHICLGNITGFLDFPVPYLVAALREYGAEVEPCTVTTPLLEHARQSPSEMRATNIANYLADDENVKEMAGALKKVLPRETDLILLPAVLGIANDHAASLLQQLLPAETKFVATMPPSVPGTRIQTLLRQYFQKLGGTLLPNDTVVKGELKNNHVERVYTENLNETPLEAGNFVLAAGSFLDGGMASNYDGIFEPVFRLDVEGSNKRTDWTTDKLFDRQPYQSYGVKTDSLLLVSKDNTVVNNMYAIGSILSGNDPRMATSTGIDLLTALSVAKIITDTCADNNTNK